jgi:hypothetical protein
MEMRFKIDDDYINSLKNTLDLRDSNDVAREALAILDWVVKETQNGRVILSSTSDGKEMYRLVTPALRALERKREMEHKSEAA